MEKIEVVLTQSRTSATKERARGSTVEVGLLEAGRLLKNQAIERPSAKDLKRIAAAEAEAIKETAAADAPVEPAPAAPVAPAETAATDAGATDAGATDAGEAKTQAAGE